MVGTVISKTTARYPFIDITVTISDPTGNSVPITHNCWVDTGFNGTIMLPIHLYAQLKRLGIKSRRVPVGLAGDTPALADSCLGSLSKIDSHQFPSGAFPLPVLFYGASKYGLVGLSLIKDWISEFDSPKKILTIAYPPPASPTPATQQ